MTPDTPSSASPSAFQDVSQDAPQAPGAVQEAAHELEAGALRTLILQVLDDDQAQDVITIDTKEKSSVTDVMIIASGRSARHVNAIADHLTTALKEAGHTRAKIEGLPACDWVLIDAGDAVVHLFRPEVRAYYNLETMWGETPADVRTTA